MTRASDPSGGRGEMMPAGLEDVGFDSQGFDPIRARDQIVDWFHETQRDRFHSARCALGAVTGEREVYETVVGAVRMVFRSHGVDFANPTREGLLCIVEALVRKASAWGTPRHAVEHHRGRLHALLVQRHN